MPGCLGATASGRLFAGSPTGLALLAWPLRGAAAVRFGGAREPPGCDGAVFAFGFPFAVIGVELSLKIMLLGMITARHRSPARAARVDDPVPVLRKLVASPEIDEAVLLSTCNRIELVALTRNPDAARLRLRSCFRFDLPGDAAGAGDLESHQYEYSGSDAMRHVLRVASSLDSMVVGEPQILGQAKDAYRAAVECGACGPILGRLFQLAFATAKRVRTETQVAARPVSVARVAVDLAEQIFEDLSGKRALLVGAGEMTEAALAALRDRGLVSVAITNRTPERAAPLAVHFGATAHGLSELPRLLAEAAVVLTSIAGRRRCSPEAWSRPRSPAGRAARCS